MDEQHGSPDEAGRSDLLAQWRHLWQQLAETTSRMSGGLGQAAATLPGVALPGVALPGLPSRVPWPGALSAAQMAGITSAIQAQRHTIQGLQSQLAAFDQQLEVLEQLVEPLTELTTMWARMEGLMGGGGGGKAASPDAPGAD